MYPAEVTSRCPRYRLRGREEVEGVEEEENEEGRSGCLFPVVRTLFTVSGGN